MSQKTWVINDRDVYRPPPTQGKVGRPSTARPAPAAGRGKNPATAFTLALLFWGGGEFYQGRLDRGAFLLGAMALFWSGIAALALFPEALNRWATSGHLPATLLPAGMAGGLGLLAALWLGSALLAYRETAGEQLVPFSGTPSRFWPPVASLLVPGWGQFLNGQPKKGSLFVLCGLLGGCSLLALVICWRFLPALQAGPALVLTDLCLVAGLTLLPFWPLFALIAAQDALLVCRDAGRKHPLGKRLQGLRLRIRMQGVVRGLFPALRETTLLLLLLAATVLAGMEYIPRKEYLDALEAFRQGLLDTNLQIAPWLIEELIHCIGR